MKLKTGPGRIGRGGLKPSDVPLIRIASTFLIILARMSVSGLPKTGFCPTSSGGGYPVILKPASARHAAKISGEGGD